ncbi:hypothetical protein Vafri_11888, partial [Volvox africanus]
DGVDGPHVRRGAFEYHGGVAEYDTGGAEGLELLGRAAVRACTREKPRAPIASGMPTAPSPPDSSPGRHARFGPAPTSALGGISLLHEPPAAAALEHLRPSPSTTATAGYGAGRQEAEAAAGAAGRAPEWALRPSSSFVGGGGEGGD